MNAIVAANATRSTLLGGVRLGDAAELRRLAKAGHAGAMLNLGVCYQFGKSGVGVDAVKAAHWYTRATEARNPPAEAYSNLANCYKVGFGVQKNLPEAARLFRIAAKMGYVDAQHNFGCCLQNGEGVPRNPVEAFTWLKRAADKGYAISQCKVGYALLIGNGVREDKAAGVAYHRRAAAQGFGMSMFNLGVCYDNGEGVPRDVPQGVVWFTRARDAGEPNAEAALATIYPTLTLEERAEVDQLLATPLPHLPALTTPAGIGGGAGGAGAPPPTRADVLTMGTPALQRLLQGRGVDTAGIDEKAQLIELALAAIGAAPQ